MKLDRNEFMLIVDATNGLMLTPGLGCKVQLMGDAIDHIALNGADKTWEVNKNEITEKLHTGTEEEYIELWKQITEYWSRRD